MTEEQPIDPGRPIVDPHHHLWDHGPVPGVAVSPKPFLLQEFVQTIDASGHNVAQTVYLECSSMYRREGPVDFRPVGETEFANGMAAMAASGRYGNCRVAAGIVAAANLRLGAAVRPVLEAQVAAGNGRLKGIRYFTAYAESGLFGQVPDVSKQGILLDPLFREGVHALRHFGLNLDVWCVHTQLGELADLAAACPEVTIILDHLGTPLKFDAHLGRDAPVFSTWRKQLVELARRPNVVVKLGGLGMDVTAPIGGAGRNASSMALAGEWRPYIETCIELFGVHRCMFASNFPVDAATCSYGALWNAFKLIVANASENEQQALFSRTACEVYGLA